MINVPGLEPRKLPSWIDGFLAFTKDVNSPEIFRRWTALSTLSGAMERRVWLRTKSGVLYPNLFTFLVGPAGIGKGNAMRPSRLLLKTCPELTLSPTSLSAASAIDSLFESKRNVVRPASHPPLISYNSLFLHIPELTVLLPAYEGEMMGKLTDLYDCQVYEEKKRTKDLRIQIPNPQFNLLAGTTPSYLNQLLPLGAWDQGFISRVVMIYSGEQILSDLGLMDEEADESESKEFKELANDLRFIASDRTVGKMEWDKDAAQAITNWHLAKGPPAPTHPRLQHYVARRTAHLMKLCMGYSISRKDHNFRITLEDYNLALSTLVEAEFFMADIFKAMVTGGDSAALDDAFHYIFTTYMKEKMAPLTQGRLISYLTSKVPAHSVMNIIEMMYRSNMIEIVGSDHKGNPLYKPVAKQLHQGLTG